MPYVHESARLVTAGLNESEAQRGRPIVFNHQHRKIQLVLAAIELTLAVLTLSSNLSRRAQ
ncbi:hypothetical protein T12_2575 [Trichinella patagoniensis]|uniref:Uncharacterized protein n=1 Tax=Trichinella patagoniensis TaxID=990121 RepID=A0A0V1A6Y1_9BILA|nr:hypothetical protein T12_2575 [Trichinella patagoniensis]